jgi:hypothetical protein
LDRRARGASMRVRRGEEEKRRRGDGERSKERGVRREE